MLEVGRVVIGKPHGDSAPLTVQLCIGATVQMYSSTNIQRYKSTAMYSCTNISANVQLYNYRYLMPEVGHVVVGEPDAARYNCTPVPRQN